MALLETLRDDFDGSTFDAVRWPYHTAAYATVGSGVASITMAGGSSDYNVVQSASVYNATDSYLVAKVVPATPSGTDSSQQTYLSWEIDANNGVMIYRVGNQLIAERHSAGVVTWFTLVASYNATTHAWWRIRHVTGAGVRYATSPDGDTWTEDATAHTISWAVTAVRVTLMVGKWSPADPAATGTFDKINLSPSTLPHTFGAATFGSGLFGDPTPPAVAAEPDGVNDGVALDAPTAAFAAAATPDGVNDALNLDSPAAQNNDTAATPDGVAVGLAQDDPSAVAVTAVAPDEGPGLSVATDDPVAAWSSVATPDGVNDAVALDNPGAGTNATATPDGVAVTINSDDPAVSPTALPDAIAVALALDAPTAAWAAACTPAGIALAVGEDAAAAGFVAAALPDGVQAKIHLTGPDAQYPITVSPHYDPIVPSDAAVPVVAQHLLGVGPWNTGIVWKGAPNHGPGSATYPASVPVLGMPSATSKSFTLRLNAGDEARADFNLPREQAIVVERFATDLWWRRRDPRRRVVEAVGRFNAQTTDVRLADNGQLNVSATFVDYRSLLEDRIVLTVADHPSAGLSSWDKGTVVTDILRFVVPTNLKLDLTEITDGTETYCGTITEPVEVPPGTTVGEAFDNLRAISTKPWEWWVELPDDNGARPKLRFAPDGRGADRGVYLIDLGTGQSPLASWSVQAASSQYANAIYFQGGTGGVVYTLPADVEAYGQRDAQEADGSLLGNLPLIQAAAQKRLHELASQSYSWSLTLREGVWEGRSHIDVGDLVNVRVALGAETISGVERVTEISVEVDADGFERVTLTLGPPKPARDPRSRYAATTRLVRTLKNYTRQDTTP
jgi:hypothetical protein